MNKPLLILAIIFGIVFLIVSGIYAALPAHSLPTFFPGYANLTKHHYTHAVASLGLSLVCFAYAWFASGKKSTK